MIKGVIFDIDGVVLDSMHIWKDIGVRYIRAKGKEPEENLSRILFPMSMEEGAAYLIRTYQLAQTKESIVEEVGKMIEAFYFDEVVVKRGIVQLLEYCKAKGISMIAATSSMREHVTRALLRNGLADYFTKILTTGEIGASKHNPLIYNMAAQNMGTMPGETLVLEDSLYALETAREAGFHVVGVYDAYGEENQEKLASGGEAYVHDLSEVISFIETLH